MDRNWQTAITFLMLGAGVVTVAGFLFGNNYLGDKASFDSPDNSSNLFSYFKVGKEKAMEAYRSGADNNVTNRPLKKNSAFCWDKNSGHYEKSDLDPIGAVVLSHDSFPKNEYADLDGDGIREEYSLNNGRLTVQEDFKILWQSDESWWVEDFFLADSDNNGKMNLNLSVWKSGNFGKYKPFWIKENDPSVKNHFFVFDLRDNDMKPVWQSSNLPAPNCRIAFYDLDADGKNELIALEGDYIQIPDCKGEYISVWKWNEWGFINEWRSEKGEFGKVGIKDTEEGKCVIGFTE